MWLLLLLLPFALSNVLFDARETAGDKLDVCQFLLKNMTDLDRLAQHEYAVLERCLYYYLAGEAAKKGERTGVAHPIAALPPNYDSRLPVTINFHQVTLQHFELNEFVRDIAIHGYMELGWQDGRLSWNSNEWKTDVLRIQSISHIWVPVFAQQEYDTSLRNGDGFELRRVEASSKGNVSALLAFSLRSFCDDSDFASYPDDTYKCCFTLEVHSNQEVVDFTTDNLPVFTDPKYFREYGWKVSGSVPRVVQEQEQQPSIGFCINLTRASSSVKIELTVPLIAAALLFLLSPFFGNIRTQIFFKLFIFCVHMLSMLLYSNRISAHQGSSASTPRLLRFLEFSLLLNVFSIAVSVFLFACARVKRNLPPWRTLIKVSSLVNQVICVLHSSQEEEDSEKSTGAGNSFQRDWTSAFSAIHAVSMLGLSLIFLLGYLLIL